MKSLRDTLISRRGVTASGYNDETTHCLFDVDEQGLSLKFSIASKGGGRTAILVRVGSKDLPAILDDIATASPHAADLFIDALRAVSAARSARSKDLVADLEEILPGAESLTKYLTDRYDEKPVGQDRTEYELLSTAETIEELLRELREQAETELPAEPPRKKSSPKK